MDLREREADSSGLSRTTNRSGIPNAQTLQVSTDQVSIHRILGGARHTSVRGRRHTCHDALAQRNGWTSKAAKDMVMRNSFGAVRSLDRKAFTVTSGPHHIGADNTANSLSTEHIPTAADRAILQGYEEEDLPRFLASTSETSARKMVVVTAGNCLSP